jgi:lipid A 3-O-deacylase
VGAQVAVLGLLLLLVPAAVSPASAQQIREVRVQVDNDNFNFWLPPRQRPDFEYTHGAQIAITTAAAPLWGNWLDAERPVCDGSEKAERHCLATTWEFGQRIYTPRANSVELIEGQRPHAGWLYGSVTAVAQGEADRHSLRLEMGMTGPPSLAGAMQTTVHELGGYWKPLGWHNQLPFEPGIIGRYDYARRLAAPEIDGVRAAEVVTRAGVAVGNIITSGGAELNARLGLHVPHSWGFDDTRAASSVSLYLLGGVGAEAFLRNLFLDGSTGRAGPRVEKLPFVQRHHVGLALRIQNVDVAYLVNTRTREYITEPSGHRYSSVVVTLRG